MPSPAKWRPAVRRRATRTATVLLALGMLAAAVTSVVTGGRAAALDELDHTLGARASSEASGLQEYFERAESVNLLLAHDTAFTAFAPGGSGRASARPPASSAEAGAAMAYLERLYPGRISEACLIDSTGTEIARVVRGRVAPGEDLSSQEAENPFFAPTMRLAQGQVYQARPYVSPDTHQWVVSNSTPLLTASGRPWALVHFEVALSSFRLVRAPGAADDQVTVSIVDQATGRLVLGDDVGVHPGRPIPTALRSLLARSAGAVQATVDGRRVAVARVGRQPHNANAWSVVVSAPDRDLGWWRSVGPAPVGMAVAALLLLALVALNLRSGTRELRDASLTDELTGLPNRRLLTDRLEQALTLSRRRGTSCAVLLIDLDRFKEVNDTLGHHHGDELLRSVATRLGAVCRTSDTVSRLGGDEFAILLPDVADLDAAVQLARRCLSALHEPLLIEGVTLDVEASIGIALAPEHGQDGNALLRSADVAMYEAKESGSGVMTYDPDLDVNTPTRLALLGDLRRALQTDQLVLHYQPKVTISTGAVHGVEALVRWQHPERGLVPPGDFVPAAEGTGLILPLTVRTLELAVAQARTWLDAGTAVQVAVNLSPRCLLEQDFPRVVLDLLTRHGLPAGLLRLEITEGTIMADPARALTALTSLKDSGISLSIDDFGTGYSSMSYLKRLPVDELKIDRSFVSEMLASSSDDVLVRSSIDLGHNLGLSVVAEGVEDQETADALTRLGCDVVQGFHLGRPMTAAAMTGWFAGRTPEAVLQQGSSHPTG